MQAHTHASSNSKTLKYPHIYVFKATVCYVRGCQEMLMIAFWTGN